jgi:hypothetical protein
MKHNLRSKHRRIEISSMSWLSSIAKLTAWGNADPAIGDGDAPAPSTHSATPTVISPSSPGVPRPPVSAAGAQTSPDCFPVPKAARWPSSAAVASTPESSTSAGPDGTPTAAAGVRAADGAQTGIPAIPRGDTDVPLSSLSYASHIRGAAAPGFGVATPATLARVASTSGGRASDAFFALPIPSSRSRLSSAGLAHERRAFSVGAHGTHFCFLFVRVATL